MLFGVEAVLFVVDQAFEIGCDQQGLVIGVTDIFGVLDNAHRRDVFGDVFQLKALVKPGVAKQMHTGVEDRGHAHGAAQTQ